MFTILHISDLHRSFTDPISNDQLVTSLLVDRDRYVNENPPISNPDAVIVSGDLIQGTASGAASFAGEIARQYDVAYEFLAEIAQRFLNGDRSRLVLVPGNHDVNWNAARAAIEAVPPGSEPTDIAGALTMNGSPFRWCWKTRTLFRITDPIVYDARMDEFWNLHDRFYSGTPLAYPIDRSMGFNIFELNEGRIAVVAFSSCHNNDCFSNQGMIPDGAVARGHLRLRDNGRRYELKMAVWHHSIHGPPLSTDYMNVDTLYDMIGCGIRLGFHGHQHRAEATPYYIHLPGRETMVAISAGSLCAGARELPRGINRQYNVIQINEDYLSARVHVRTMLAGTMFGKASFHSFEGDSFIDVKWDPATEPYRSPADEATVRMRSAILEAEVAFQSEGFDQVQRVLAPYRDRLESYGRRLLTESIRRARLWPELIDHTTPPQTVEELIFHVDALQQIGRYRDALAALDTHGPRLNLPMAVRDDLVGRLEAIRRLHE